MERFRPARAQTKAGHHWNGSATLHSDDLAALYEYSTLNPEEWLILGLEIYGSGEHSAGAVLAVSKDSARTFDDLHRAAMESGGAVRARRFEILAPPWGVGGFRMLKSFRKWSIQAAAAALEDQEIEFEVPEEIAT
ncbi:MAG: hypothetical protein ABR509_07745 [Candidatus Limnocylindria bacterium]